MNNCKSCDQFVDVEESGHKPYITQTIRSIVTLPSRSSGLKVAQSDL